MDYHTHEIKFVSPINQSYINLIIRPAEELRSEKGRVGEGGGGVKVFFCTPSESESAGVQDPRGLILEAALMGQPYNRAGCRW